ncbi:hypothetical protein Tco_0279767, partial [Tanacetum coccineum]
MTTIVVVRRKWVAEVGDGSGDLGSGDESEVNMKMVEKRWCGEMWCRLEWWMPANGGWKIPPEIGRIIWRHREFLC